MNVKSHIAAIAAVTFNLIVAGCGGGGGGSNVPPPVLPPPVLPAPGFLPPGFIPTGPLLVMGPVTAINSISLGDVTLETSRSQVVVNNAPGSMQDILLNQVVAVIGTANASGQLSADEIHFNANIAGPIDSIDLATNSLVVMGQPVTVMDETMSGKPLAAFSSGEFVQVSGYTDSGGNTTASRIDEVINTQQHRLIGIVTVLDPVNFRFVINNLTIDYSMAITIDVPGGQLVDGLEVQLTGTLSPSGEFDVTSVTAVDRTLTDFVGATIRAEGLITDAMSGSDFSINGFPVTMGGQRDYRQGSSADIAIGAEVRVEGHVLNNGNIQVHRVWFLHN